MPTGLESIRKTLSHISQDDGVLEMLMEFERTLGSTEIFSYKNWLLGELIHGPKINRYWFKTVWMFKQSEMPDPDGALRLAKIGCKVLFKKDTLAQPRKLVTPQDWEDRSSKKVQLDEIPIWLVSIAMPMKYINDRFDNLQATADDLLNAPADNVQTEETDETEEDEMDIIGELE